jgi:hypothetical protein
MLAGDCEQPFKQGWDGEVNYKRWMVLWIGTHHRVLVAAYKAKAPKDPEALAEMKRLLAVMEECKDKVSRSGGAKHDVTWIDAGQLEGVLNKLLSKDAPQVLTAMSDACRIKSTEAWEAAKAATRAIWDAFKATTEGQPLREASWELAVSLRDTFPTQLPSTYRFMLYKVLFKDLAWMDNKKLPDEMEQMVRTLYPNPPGLSYVPWKPPSQRGTGKKRQQQGGNASSKQCKQAKK